MRVLASLAALALALLTAPVSAAPPAVKQYSALTPAVALAPGEVTNAFHRLPIPPGPIAVYRFAAEVVAPLGGGREQPAPSFDAYLHHHVVASAFRRRDDAREGRHAPMKPANASRSIAFGAGTEARGTPQQFPFPFAFVTEAGEDEWVANVHVINTRGLPPAAAHRCLECPCTAEDNTTADAVNGWRLRPESCNAQLRWEDNSACSAQSYHGGLRCCEDGEFCLEREQLERLDQGDQSPTAAYQLRYSLEYADVAPDNRALYVAGCCDASGDLEHTGNIEYDVPACDPETHPGCVHTLSTRQRLDMNGQASVFNGGGGAGGPAVDGDYENREVELVYAVGHQHRGGLGIELYDDASGDLLCSSVPSYGTGKEAGNELGYVVAMSTCSFDPPHRMRASDIVRVVALYNNTEAHTGVMSLMYLALSDVEPNTAAAAVDTSVATKSSKKALVVHGVVLFAVAAMLSIVIVVVWKRFKARSQYSPLQSPPPTPLAAPVSG